MIIELICFLVNIRKKKQVFESVLTLSLKEKWDHFNTGFKNSNKFGLCVCVHVFVLVFRTWFRNSIYPNLKHLTKFVIKCLFVDKNRFIEQQPTGGDIFMFTNENIAPFRNVFLLSNVIKERNWL